MILQFVYLTINIIMQYNKKEDYRDKICNPRALIMAC